MKRLLLIEPFQVRDRGDLHGQLDCEPPLGLMSIAANNPQYHTEILDCFAEGYYHREKWEGKMWRVGLPDDEIRTRIRSFKPDIVGVSCLFFFNAPAAHHVCELAREEGVRNILMGGIYPTVKAAEASRFCTRVVRGEGERRLDDPNAPDIVDLDELKAPDRSLISLERYQAIGKPFGQSVGRRFTTISTSRGCPYKCTFCAAHNLWGYRIRYHSAKYVLAETDMLMEKYGIEELHIVDENFTLNRSRLIEIMKGFRERGIRWSCPNGVALATLSPTIVELMAESGCFSLGLAIESGDQEMLSEVIKKKLDLAKAVEIVRAVKANGISSRTFFIIGFPGESKQQVIRTVKLANELGTDYVGMNKLKIYAGTPLEGMKVPREKWIDAIIEADRILALTRKGRARWREVFVRNGLVKGLYVLWQAARLKLAGVPYRSGGPSWQSSARCGRDCRLVAAVPPSGLAQNGGEIAPIEAERGSAAAGMVGESRLGTRRRYGL